MKRLTYLVLLIFLLCFVVYAAAPNAAVGQWTCTSTDERGTKSEFTLVVDETACKLTAQLIFSATGDRSDLFDPKWEGGTFTFKIRVNDQETVEVITRLKGGRLEGTFRGRESGSGTMKGIKQPKS